MKGKDVKTNFSQEMGYNTGEGEFIRACPPGLDGAQSFIPSLSTPRLSQIPSYKVESIMEDHPLLPPIQDTFAKGDAESYVLAVSRRFPALCKLLATLIAASPPKARNSEVSRFLCVV